MVESECFMLGENRTAGEGIGNFTHGEKTVEEKGQENGTGFGKETGGIVGSVVEERSCDQGLNQG